MKKILLIHDYPPCTGGGLAINVRDLARSLEHEFKCKIITSRINDDFADDAHRQLPKNVIFLKNKVFLLIKLIKEFLESNLEIINFTFSFRFLSLFSLVTNYILKRNSIIVVHTGLSHLNFNRFKNNSKNITKLILYIFAFLANKCELVVVFNNNQRDELQNIGIYNIYVLPMFIYNSEKLNQNYSMSFSKVNGSFYYIGELSSLKGFNCLLEQLSNEICKHIDFVIVGDGEYYEIAKHFVDNCKFSNVKIMRTVSNEQLKIILSDAFCLVFPSENDTWGRIIAEAMLSGVPVITRNIGIASVLPKDCYIEYVSTKCIYELAKPLIMSKEYRDYVIHKAKHATEQLNLHSMSKWRSLISELS